MKKKLLLGRYIERILSFLRLLGLAGIGVWIGFSLLDSFNHKTDSVKIILLIVAFGITFLIKYPLDMFRKKNDFFIDNFEDTSKWSRKKGKYGEFDEDGDLNIGLLLKRGSNDAVADLEKLIGLDNVKYEILKLKSVFEFEKDHAIKGGNVSRHYCFSGNPGTGKTTCAQILSGLLYEYGRIKYNMYLECTGSDLTGEFAGQTKAKVNAIFKRCRGGVLFIDEAYILGQSSDSIASEAIAQLLVHMESEKDTVIILAGYTQNMNNLLSINPGLASRISTIIEFPDYSADELIQITKKFMKKKDIILSPDAETALLNVYQEKIDRKESDFSNGRYARNCFDEIYQQHALLYQTKGLELSMQAETISLMDIISIKDKLLNQS